jgi:beta-xylosidase
MLKRNFLFIILLASCNQKAYLFSTFREPATEGLRLAYSYDGYHWKDFDTTFLKPAVDSNVMRDPSIVQGPDGTYHLVFTSAWKGSQSFGYANSKDLIHWNQQTSIPVMQNEPTTVNIWAPELFYDNEDDQFIIVFQEGRKTKTTIIDCITQLQKILKPSLIQNCFWILASVQLMLLS